MLQMLEPVDLAQAGYHTPLAVHYITEAERRVYADRSTYLGDPDFGVVPTQKLLDVDYNHQRAATMRSRGRATPSAMLAAGPALRRGYNGVFDLDFALRFEASDLSIRAHQLRVNALQFEGLPPQTSALLSAYGPSLAQQSLQDVVLHQLKPQDLALPDGMGLQPGSITVTAQGLVIAFVPKSMIGGLLHGYKCFRRLGRGPQTPLRLCVRFPPDSHDQMR